jgi:hypothetical protein
MHFKTWCLTGGSHNLVVIWNRHTNRHGIFMIKQYTEVLAFKLYCTTCIPAYITLQTGAGMQEILFMKTWHSA